MMRLTPSAGSPTRRHHRPIERLPTSLFA